MSIVDNRDGLLEAGPGGRTNAAPCRAHVLETRAGEGGARRVAHHLTALLSPHDSR